MARRPKPSGRLNRGPWTGTHARRMFERAGWEECSQRSSHLYMRHASRPGSSKITVDVNHTGIRAGDDVFKSWMSEGAYSKRELLELLNGF